MLPCVVRTDEDALWLEDETDGSDWAYSLRVFKETALAIRLELTSPAPRLHEDLATCLADTRYGIVEDFESDELALARAFRVKSKP